MERKSFADMGCSVAQCLEAVGDSWTMLIVRDAFSGVRRFDDFQYQLGIPRNTLVDRLAKLVKLGVLEKMKYSDRPARFEYRLTTSGEDLWPVLCAMRQWGDSHGDPKRPKIRLLHSDCGAVQETVTICSHCHKPLNPDDAALHNLSVRGKPVVRRDRVAR